MSYSFGSGVLIGTRSDIANPTPRQFGILQEASVDFAFNSKDLMGQFVFPVASARGSGKINGKAKFANINSAMFNDLFFLGTTAANEERVAVNEQLQVATNTATVANGATFLEDLGVFNRTTTRWMTRVASAPAAGQYSVNISTGVYTFAAADANPAVTITYRYTFTNANGGTLTMNNVLQGVNPTFTLVLATQYNGQQVNLKLNAVTSTKLSIGAKIEDFMMPDFDFSAYADPTGVIGKWSFNEAL